MARNVRPALSPVRFDLPLRNTLLDNDAAPYLEGYPLSRVAQLRARGAAWDGIARRIGLAGTWRGPEIAAHAARLLWEADGEPGAPTWESAAEARRPDGGWLSAAAATAFFTARTEAFDHWLLSHAPRPGTSDA